MVGDKLEATSVYFLEERSNACFGDAKLGNEHVNDSILCILIAYAVPESGLAFVSRVVARHISTSFV